MDYADYVPFACELADLARPIARSHFRTSGSHELKGDGSPVTLADREIELCLRAAIRAAHPEHGILGEEEGPERIDARFVWVLDPIDGTRGFLAGKPLFGTLIALFENGYPVVGIIDQPILDERWVGCTGRATTFNGEPIHVRAAPDLAASVVYLGWPACFDIEDRPGLDAIEAIAPVTLFDCDCYAYGLLAMGQADLVLEADLEPYDYGALVPIIRGAGGFAATWGGDDPGFETDGTFVAAGDESLARAALRHLGR
ncbi:MAG: histidinol phosphate phosphatase [bacterium]|nr:histidinol phosphate phosphatase [bacterium]